MALQYYLLPAKNLNTGSGAYYAVSLSTKTCTFEDLLEEITREGSTVTRAEALAFFEEFTATVMSLLKQGNAVDTPLIKLRPSVRGSFAGGDDSFDPGRHEVYILARPAVRLKKAASRIRPGKISVPNRHPDPRHYHDSATGSRNHVITPGGGARITGSLLKIVREDASQGIFFIHVQSGGAVQVDNRRILYNKPAELIFTNPELPPGTYRLEVRCTPHRVTIPRTGRLNAELTVNDEA